MGFSMQSRTKILAEQYNADLPHSLKEEVAEVQQQFERKHQNKPRKVLLIGGSGYIGTVVAFELLDKGYHVRNLDKHVYGNTLLAGCYVAHPNYEFSYGDFCKPEELDRALNEVTDVVFLAGLVGDPITRKYPAEAEAINDKGVKNALNQLNGKGLSNVLFISTCSNYGLIKSNELANENFELNPLSSYARDKVGAEQLIMSLKGSVDFSPTILRFATAFGLSPRMRFDLTVNEFTRTLVQGKDLLVFDADTWRPYCHVKDFARLIRRVMELSDNRSSFEVFNAGGVENNATKRSLVEKIVERIPNSVVNYQEKGSDPRNYKVNFDKVREKLHFTPSFSLDYGIDEVILAHKRGLYNAPEIELGQLGNYSVRYS